MHGRRHSRFGNAVRGSRLGARDGGGAVAALDMGHAVTSRADVQAIEPDMKHAAAVGAFGSQIRAWVGGA
jgi:hypothetical protein